MNGRRFLRGFGWGVVATIAMSIPMVAGVLTGVSPMPKPIPGAIVGTIFGPMPWALLMGLAALSHLAYGGFWGGVLVASTARVTVWKALALSVVLWLLMDLAILPWLGWGLFGANVTPMIGVATLALHLIYGVTLGWLAARTTPGQRVHRLRKVA